MLQVSALQELWEKIKKGEFQILVFISFLVFADQILRLLLTTWLLRVNSGGNILNRFWQLARTQ